MAGYLASVGLKILANNYNIIPIKSGEKFPVIKGWENLVTTPDMVPRWLRNGHADAGVGITTGEISFVDDDTPDPEAAEFMRDYMLTHVGPAPMRIGNAPKHGFMYRAATPFRKLSSKTWVNEKGDKSRIEVLGIGQQFVAYHIHPETLRPYRWSKNDNPLLTPVSDLPEITETQAQAACDAYDAYALSRGWTIYRPVKGLPATMPRTTIVDDEFGLGTDPVGLTDEEITAKVMQVPNQDWEYEDGEINWLHFLMAIHHETEGSPFGRDLALEWSMQSGKHTNEMFDKTWRSFGEEGKQSRRLITFRYILRWAKFFHREAAKVAVNDIILAMDLAGDADELRNVAEEARKLDVDVVDRSRMITAIRKNFARFNVTLTPKEAREMVRYQASEEPDWLKGWVYLSHPDRFFNTESKISLTERAFNNTYLEFTGDALPATIALQHYKIRKAYMSGYNPGAEDFYTLNGLEFANTYSERNVPKVPAKLEGVDRENVELVFRHFQWLFPDRREREITISWFAHIVQTRERPNWALVLQGVEGDGRSFLGSMMAAVLGGDNARTIDADTLADKDTSWAVGQLFTMIEEIRLIGHNRYDIMNKMKPYITNATINVRPLYVSSYNALNTTGYVMTTNYQNALPITDTDRRIFAPRPHSQSADAVRALGPAYFNPLWDTLKTPGAIRGWLLKYKLHPEFDHKGRAPDSYGKMQMIEQSKSDELVEAEDLIESGFHADISTEIVVVSRLAEVLSEKNAPYRVKETACAAILRQLGLTYVGRVRIGGRRLAVWSKNPERFMRGNVPSTVQIAKYLENPL